MTNSKVSAFTRFDAINKKFGAWVTKVVGTMYCAYFFALMVLPGYFDLHTFKDFAQYTSTSFLQLVLLSIIMVGQQVLNEASENRMNEAVKSIMEQFKMNQDEIAELRSMHEMQNDLIIEIHTMHTDILGKVTDIHSSVQVQQDGTS